MRLGVLGGTFDPPHVGHLVLAQRALEQLALERVFWVPAGEPWRKADQPVTASGHRLALVRLAVGDEPAFAVSTVDLDRAGPSYSVDTLDELSRRHSGSELFLLLGRDALADLPNWHEPERLVSLATLAVAGRAGSAQEVALPEGARVVVVEMPRIDVSATELRERAARGLSLRYLVPDAVATYIQEQGLYR